MDKVVIIGGSGFMGSHTADALSDLGYEVILFDHLPSEWLREDQKMVIGNILDTKVVAEVLKNARFVYHFAGIADIGQAKEYPYETINLNVMGTATALQAAIEAKCERFIYASTMYVYSPYGSFYRASKQAAETLIEAYNEKFNIDYTILRYGSLYGPRAQDWNGIQRYVSQIINQKRLDYYGTGKEKREYIHVKDAARLSTKVLDDKYKNQAFTVTGNQVLNSNELIDMIFEISGIEKNVDFINENLDSDHYETTPYRYSPKQAKKIVPDEFIDLGQGILELVEELHNKINQS